MDYKDIIKNVAKKNLSDATRFFLDIVDEVLKEQQSKCEKFASIAKKWNLDEDDIEILLSTVVVFDSCKKEIVRKRVLDKMNEMLRDFDK